MGSGFGEDVGGGGGGGAWYVNDAFGEAVGGGGSGQVDQGLLCSDVGDVVERVPAEVGSNSSGTLPILLPGAGVEKLR